MNKDSFEGAEITIYTRTGEQLNFELSQMQAFTAMKILGINFTGSNSYSCYSDEALQRFFEFKGNPLNLKEMN